MLRAQPFLPVCIAAWPCLETSEQKSPQRGVGDVDRQVGWGARMKTGPFTLFFSLPHSQDSATDGAEDGEST